MIDDNLLYTPLIPPSPADPTTNRKRSRNPFEEDPQPKPDWLLILISVLFLLTLLIAWLVDIPGLMH
ncbi:hypothetical protein [Spirosoma koreense]